MTERLPLKNKLNKNETLDADLTDYADKTRIKISGYLRNPSNPRQVFTMTQEVGVKLKKVYVEITNRCNLSCDFCVTTKRKLGYISKERFERVVKNVKPHTDYIYLHVLGEPLLHPELGVLLDVAAFYDMKVSITTNATLINKRAADILGKKSLRQLNYSLHSFVGNNSILRDVFDFIESAPDIYHCLRLWNAAQNAPDENSFFIEEIARHFGVNLENKITSGNGIKIRDNVFLQINRRFTWPDLSLSEIFTSGKCYGLKGHVGVLLDGTVVPCCLDAEGAIPLGNIYEDPLSKILSCHRAENIRESFKKNIPIEPLCRTCGFKN